jgi:prepilin-type N-terminal cleavage/methylation domain-containing protein
MKTIRSLLKNNRGFTLTELAIVLIIFGFVSSVVFLALQKYMKHGTLNTTRENMDISQGALLEFQAKQGRYPCPADPEVPSTDIDYGREDCGLPRVNGEDIDGDGVPEQVMIGSLPFAEMLEPANGNGVVDAPFSQNTTLDGWSHKLTYAVTVTLTDENTFNDREGAIDVVDEYDRSVLANNDFVHLAVVSHGEDGRGAYTLDGEQIDTCGAGVSLPPSPDPDNPALANNELENCDNDGVFMSGLRNDLDHSYNDDYVKFLMSQVSSHWTFVAVGRVRNTNPGQVGIGTNAPEQQLDVNGDISGDQVMADDFCDPIEGPVVPDPADPTRRLCTTTELFAGNVPDMQCPHGEAIVSIQENRVVCQQVFPPLNPPPAGFRMMCPAGEVMTGVDATTGVQCAPLE